jgi:hypothetical protein
LNGWGEFNLFTNPRFFRKVGQSQVGQLAASLVGHAVSGFDLSIAWGVSDLCTTPADELEAVVFHKLRPAVIVLPERPGKIDRWTMSIFSGTPATVPAAALPQLVMNQIETLYPLWRPGAAAWTCTAFLLRHSISAEELGLVDEEPLTGDKILNMVAGDPEVRAAFVREDPAFPETIYALAVARLAAQRRMGIPIDKCVLLYSTEAETLLTPPLMRMVRGDEVAVLAALRRQLRHFRELADFVLISALRDYAHAFPHLERLREAARATAVAA